MSLKSIAVAAVLLVAAGVNAQQDEKGAKLKALLDSKSACIVTVRAVITTEMSFMGNSQESESRVEEQGVLVDASGLVMLSNSAFESNMPGITGAAEGQIDVAVTPGDIKVVFGKEEKEHDAWLAASDSKLGLAFVKVKDMGAVKRETVSFDAEPSLPVGSEVVMIGRQGKGFDYAPYFALGRVTGEIAKPRPAFMLGGSTGVGMPVFTTAGEVLGAVVTIESGVDEDDGGGNPLAFLRNLRSGLTGSQNFLLPAKSIKAVIEQAKRKIADAKPSTAPADEKKDGGEAEKKDEKAPPKDG